MMISFDDSEMQGIKLSSFEMRKKIEKRIKAMTDVLVRLYTRIEGFILIHIFENTAQSKN